MTSTTVRVPLILESPRDWQVWYEAIRRRAVANEIFQYINPDQAEKPIPPTVPIEPNHTTIDPDSESYDDLTNAEKEKYKFLIGKYRTALDRHNILRKRFIDIENVIQDTIAVGLRPHIRGKDHPYDVLKALKKRLAPTDRARRLELTRDLQTLKKDTKKSKC